MFVSRVGFYHCLIDLMILAELPVVVNLLCRDPDLNPIPTGLGHVMLIYGLIPPMAGRNRVKEQGDQARQLTPSEVCAQAIQA